MQACLLAIALLLGAAASATDITVLSTTGMTAVLGDLAPTFEARTGDKLIVSYAVTSALKKRIEAGEGFDLALLTAPAIDDLLRQGKLAAGSRTDLARSAIGVAIRKGAAKPDISSVEAFKQTLLQAKSVAYTTEGASGAYFAGLLQRLGIADAIKAKAHTIPGGPVGDFVAKGDADLAVQQITELLPVAGIELLGPLPPELQNITIFSAGIAAGAKNAAGAKALVEFLTTPDAMAAVRIRGMEPGS